MRCGLSIFAAHSFVGFINHEQRPFLLVYVVLLQVFVDLMQVGFMEVLFDKLIFLELLAKLLPICFGDSLLLRLEGLVGNVGFFLRHLDVVARPY